MRHYTAIILLMLCPLLLMAQAGNDGHVGITYTVDSSLAKQNKVITQKDWYAVFSVVNNPSFETRWALRSEVRPFDFVYNKDGDRKIFDTIFSKSDTAYLKEQAVNSQHFVWGPGGIRGGMVINKSDIDQIIRSGTPAEWDAFERETGFREYWCYSVPLFSKDGNICVVKYSNYSDIGKPWGLVAYYIKNVNSWNLAYSYRTWVRE